MQTIARQTVIHYRLSEQPSDYPGECHRCHARIVTRSSRPAARRLSLATFEVTVGGWLREREACE